jgi:nitric oxide reductase NorQ protein
MQGCGKTLIARTAARVLVRPTFVFPLGEVSDPKSFLLGNSHFDPTSGTVFYPSRFIRAIQTKGAVIILDELTRPHPDVQNILMSVLDSTMRYLILDESKESAVVPVADGVTFIATANIGNEFTATRILDRALTDRFTFIEMPVLTKDEELALLKMMYPSVNADSLDAVADIATKTRDDLKKETPKLSTSISTRMSVEIAGLLYDGFTLAEACEVCVYPFFPAEGGLESERVFVKQMVQGYIDDGSSNALFGEKDINSAPAS